MIVIESQGVKMHMTPNRFRDKGGLECIRYGVREMELGTMLVARTHIGVCALTMSASAHHLIEILHEDFPNATFVRDDDVLREDIDLILGHARTGSTLDGLVLDVQATKFEARVWEGLLQIPWGKSETYGVLASKLGNPRAARAVGRACGANPVSIVIPCHRMHGHDGKLVKYAWGLDRKAALRHMEGIR